MDDVHKFSPLNFPLVFWYARGSDGVRVRGGGGLERTLGGLVKLVLSGSALTVLLPLRSMWIYIYMYV